MKLLRIAHVKDKFGYRSDSSVFTSVNDGLLPPGINIGTRSKAWPEYEIDSVIAARIAGKNEIEIKTLVKNIVNARKSCEVAL